MIYSNFTIRSKHLQGKKIMIIMNQKKTNASITLENEFEKTLFLTLLTRKQRIYTHHLEEHRPNLPKYLTISMANNSKSTPQSLTIYVYICNSIL